MTYAVAYNEENIGKAFSTDRDSGRGRLSVKNCLLQKDGRRQVCLTRAVEIVASVCRTNITLLQSAPYPNSRPQLPWISQRHQ